MKLKVVTFISYTGTNSYQLVDRYEVLLTDEDAVSDILTNESIIVELRNELEKQSKRAILLRMRKRN